jgi:hypothetical protein
MREGSGGTQLRRKPKVEKAGETSMNNMRFNLASTTVIPMGFAETTVITSKAIAGSDGGGPR